MTDDQARDPDDEDLVWQPRCPNCLHEHYVLNVVSISAGLVPCGNCGQRRSFNTEEEYREALRATYARLDEERKKATREERNTHLGLRRPPEP